MIDSNFIKTKLDELKGLGVNISKSVNLKHKTLNYSKILSTASELFMVEALGDKIGFTNLNYEPTLGNTIEPKDADISAKIDGQNYYFQHKYFNFFEANYGKKIFVTIENDFYHILRQKRKNGLLKIHYSRFGTNREEFIEIDPAPQNASFGYFTYSPEFLFDNQYLTYKFNSAIQDAAYQLKKFTGIKIVSIDITHLPIGEDIAYNITTCILDKFTKFSDILCVLLLSFDIKANNIYATRDLIPVPNNNFKFCSNDYDISIFKSRTADYFFTKMFFAFPSIVNVQKGWAEWFNIKNKHLYHNDILYGKIF